jgi:hypothetical protein
MDHLDAYFRRILINVLKFAAPAWELFTIWWLAIAWHTGAGARTLFSTALFMQIPILIPVLLPLIAWGISTLFNETRSGDR